MNTFLPIICGFNKASEIGADTFAPSIFLRGCNFKCPYCMNLRLVKGDFPDKIDLEIVKKFVQEEKCEWLMISGGEPTCTSQESLIYLLKEIESWGCKIGMSTNGSNYTTLYHIIEYIDYVALDIKCSTEDDYIKVAEGWYDYAGVMNSRKLLWILKDTRKGFDYELRTTLYPPFIDKDKLSKIGSNIIEKSDKWVLQQFRHSQNMLDPNSKNIKPYSDDMVKTLIDTAKQFCDNVSLRYV